MDSWQWLRSKSTLPDGHDAWENLVSVQAVSGLTIVTDMEIEMESLCFEVYIEEEYEAEMDIQEYEISTDDEYEVEVCL